MWDEGVRARVQAALLGTRRSYAEETAPRVVARLDRYATEWSSMRREVCVASARRSEPRRELLELRDACLERRRGQLQALTAMLAEQADGDVLDHAVTAGRGGSLPPSPTARTRRRSPPACAPREDPAVRARVAELLPRLDRLGALYKAGKYRDGLAFGEPLVVETDALPTRRCAPRSATAWASSGRGSASTSRRRRCCARPRSRRRTAGTTCWSRYAWSHAALRRGRERQGHREETAVIEGLGRMVVARAQDEVAQASWMNARGSAWRSSTWASSRRRGTCTRRALAIRERVQDPTSTPTSPPRSTTSSNT